MKALLITGISIGTIVALAAGIYVYSRINPKVYESAMVIRASAAEVWAVLTDLDSYQQWNPSIISASGTIAVGERLHNTVRFGDGTMEFRPRILTATAERELRWVGHMYLPGLADGEHSFHITDRGDGTVQLTQREEFTGVLTPFAQSYLAGLEDEFAQTNQALATEVAQRRAATQAGATK